MGGIQTLQNWRFMALGKHPVTVSGYESRNRGSPSGRMRLYATMHSKAKSGPGLSIGRMAEIKTASVSSGTEIRKLTSSDPKKTST